MSESRSLPRFVTPAEAGRLLADRAEAANVEQVAVVRNPDYVGWPFDLYPLANRHTGPLDRLVAVVKDMDGTTTTTEPLCLHSLEFMVRVLTDRPTKQQWAGFDRDRDLPHVIGNSTTRHVEYLIDTYGPEARPESFARGYLRAVGWTLAHGRDPGREREVRQTAVHFGLADSLEELAGGQTVELPAGLADRLMASRSETVRAAIDVYYARYHEILAAIDAGRGSELAADLLGEGARRLVAPMPGAGAFVAMVKGWLGDEAGGLYDLLAASLDAPAGSRDQLAALGRRFATEPAKVAVVTSSIAYEAGIVLREVFAVIREELADWPVSAGLRQRLLAGFAEPATCYDAIVTASDSAEIRLKPHRDLYSIALHALGVGPVDYGRVIGFEDSESGLIAIRAAGVGLCVAVPFAETAGHDLSAASIVLHKGLPEALLRHGLFLA